MVPNNLGGTHTESLRPALHAHSPMSSTQGPTSSPLSFSGSPIANYQVRNPFTSASSSLSLSPPTIRLPFENPHQFTTSIRDPEAVEVSAPQASHQGENRPLRLEFAEKDWAGCRCLHERGMPQRMDRHWRSCRYNSEREENPCGQGLCTETFPGRKDNRRRHQREFCVYRVRVATSPARTLR